MPILQSAVDGRKHQHIYGIVDRDGSLIAGEGFRCRRLQEGTYLIEFEQPFEKTPAPVSTVYGPPWITFNLSSAIIEATQRHFVCITSSPDHPVDSGFSFIAFGDI